MKGSAANGSAIPELRDVSRETIDRLACHGALLTKWNPRINLVSAASLADYWSRHVLDSMQLFSLRPAQARVWVDIGTGGGFPGLVVAILAAEQEPEMRVTLVESDHRKAAFLSQAIRATGVTAQVIAARAEDIPRRDADVISARAVAPLDRLLKLVERHLATGGRALLPKGAAVEDELRLALEYWRFDLHKIASVTNPEAAILSIGDLSRV